MFSSQVKSLVKKLARWGELSPEIAYTYLYARSNNYPTHYFPINPDDQEKLDEIPKNAIFNEKLEPDWVKEWIKLWPAPKDTGLDYSVSGAFPDCRKRFTQFLKQWNERVGDCCDDPPLEDKLDLIESATKAYLKFKEDQGWAYTKKNFKFIIDSNGSELEQWIRRVVQDDVMYHSKSFSL